MRTIVTAFVICLLFQVAAQGQDGSFTLTTSPTAVNGIRAVIDNPALNGNADAIILVTSPLYAHPMAVWYLANKWHVFNTDQANMGHREKFEIQYWIKSDSNHFAHVVTPQNLRGNRSYIDSPALNNKPGASWSLFQSMSNVRGGYWNANEATAEYDQTDKKWYVVNKNGLPVLAGNAYNVVVFDAPQPVVTATPPLQGTLLPDLRPKGAAGGDLTGNYPEPLVKGLRGRTVSAAPPSVGDTLRWNGTEWTPAAGTSAPVPPTSVPAGTVPSLMQTYFRTGELTNWSAVLGGNTKFDCSQLRHSFTVAKRSRLVISGMISVTGPVCPLGCGPASGFFYASIDGNVDSNVIGYSTSYVTLGALDIKTANISNYMFDVQPGNHTVDFAFRHIETTSGLKVKPTFSSIMIIPLE